MNACVSGKRRLSGKGGDFVSCDTVQVIRGGRTCPKGSVQPVRRAGRASEGLNVVRMSALLTGRLYPSRNSHASLDDGDTF